MNVDQHAAVCEVLGLSLENSINDVQAILRPLRAIAQRRAAMAKGYKCSRCNARHVKLWRFPHMSDGFLCAACSCVEQAVDGSAMDDAGRVPMKYHSRVMTDQIGNRIPAVPDGIGGIWGYSSVSVEDGEWWAGLPNEVTT